MRDILITLIIFGSLPLILARPYIGVLVWAWLSYMNPHRLTWDYAYSMPFAQIVAITLIIAIFFHKGPKNLPVNSTVVLWIFFVLWMAITTLFAIYPELAYPQFIKVIKIQLVTFITMILFRDIQRINQLVWVIVASIGFFSLKGGIFTILTGGAYRVWGPPDSYISENNALALATLMIIPLMVYLGHIAKQKWVRMSLIIAAIISFVSVLGSQSRGALIAALAVAFFFWVKSRTKILSGTLMALVLVGGLAIMPESWDERMESIANYEEDASAMGRINAWIYSINMANDRLMGGGFNSWSMATYAVYNPKTDRPAVAHSIYFGALADHGWIGLLLFLAIMFSSWRACSYVARLGKNDKRYENHGMLARMLQVSLIAYASGGAFLSLTYFDLPWHIVAISVLLKWQIDQETNQAADQELAGAARAGGGIRSIS